MRTEVKCGVLPGVATVAVVGTDCMEHCYAVVVVQDFVEGAHAEIGLVVGPMSADQD